MLVAVLVKLNDATRFTNGADSHEGGGHHRCCAVPWWSNRKPKRVEPYCFGYPLSKLHTAMLRNHCFKCDPVIFDLVDLADP